MNLPQGRRRRSTRGNSDLACKTAKITSAVLLSGLAISTAVAVVAARRRPGLPEPAEAPPRADDPLR